jgi:ubiquinone/menaquinone biosynthesis C-methylase UbiE
VNEDEGMRIFLEIHQDNPQEGPGDFASTRRAFSLLKDLPPLPHILDAGCGPGRQTFDLCRLTKGNIVAVDFHRPYIDALQRKSKALGLTQQITAQLGDMANLQFQPQIFEVIWSEGAIYNIGFKAGLTIWKPLLKKGGYVAVTEVAWLLEFGISANTRYRGQSCRSSSRRVSAGRAFHASGIRMVGLLPSN